MYLISLLVQGIIGIMLLVFIITTMIGVYSHINGSAKISEDSSKLNEKADEQINEDMIYDKHAENEEELIVETELLDINYTETTIEIEELAQMDSANLELTKEYEVQSSTESELNADNKEEIYTSKSSNRRSKKKRV